MKCNYCNQHYDCIYTYFDLYIQVDFINKYLLNKYS